MRQLLRRYLVDVRDAVAVGVDAVVLLTRGGDLHVGLAHARQVVEQPRRADLPESLQRGERRDVRAAEEAEARAEGHLEHVRGRRLGERHAHLEEARVQRPQALHGADQRHHQEGAAAQTARQRGVDAVGMSRRRLHVAVHPLVFRQPLDGARRQPPQPIERLALRGLPHDRAARALDQRLLGPITVQAHHATRRLVFDGEALQVLDRLGLSGLVVRHQLGRLGDAVAPLVEHDSIIRGIARRFTGWRTRGAPPSERTAWQRGTASTRSNVPVFFR